MHRSFFVSFTDRLISSEIKIRNEGGRKRRKSEIFITEYTRNVGYKFYDKPIIHRRAHGGGPRLCWSCVQVARERGRFEG